MINSVSLKVSIITVCYNSEKTIEDTIKSVLGQDYPAIEYIVIDGNSSDGTLGIVKKYESGVAKVLSEPDEGIYDAMNKGIDLARGDIIGILNSDDIFVDGSTISTIVKEFSNQDIDLLYGNIVFFKDDPAKPVRKWITKPYYKSFFDDGEIAPHPAFFVKKSVYNEIGKYYPHLKIAADYEFILRSLKIFNYKSFYLNRFIVNMRLGGESTKSIKNTAMANKEVKMAWQMNNIKPPIKFWPLRISKKILQYLR